MNTGVTAHKHTLALFYLSVGKMETSHSARFILGLAAGHSPFKYTVETVPWGLL